MSYHNHSIEHRINKLKSLSKPTKTIINPSIQGLKYNTDISKNFIIITATSPMKDYNSGYIETIINGEDVGKDNAYINIIVVHDQKQGIARELIERTEGILKKRNIIEVFLTPVFENAIKFWEHMGYSWNDNVWRLRRKKMMSKKLSNLSTNTLFKYEDETDNIALERYPISSLTKLGAGSDRIVYDLKDGNVIKVAKSPRGLLQNTYETPDYYLKDLLPEVKETGFDYVVVEKLDINRKKANQFLKPLKHLYPKDFDNKTEEIQNAFEQMNISKLLNYDVLFNDLKAPRNWGFRNNKPVLIDGGTLNADILDKKVISYYIPEWKKVLLKRRQWKKLHA